MDYWKILLTKQKERGKKGFTLPFLIGSQTHLPSIHNLQDIRDIIIDMAMNDSFETCIRYCLDTNALIFEIRNQKNQVVYPKFNGSQQTNMSVAKGNDNLGNTVEEVIERLKEMYQDKINVGHYSARTGIENRETLWGRFNSSDEDFIKDCFRTE